MQTILLVDADAELLAASADFLAAPNRVVLTRSDGYEALRLLVERPVDLLITDVKMPGITGFTLARLATLVRPNLRVVYTAGYDCTTGSRGELAAGPLLRKPFRHGQLLQAVDASISYDGSRSPSAPLLGRATMGWARSAA